MTLFEDAFGTDNVGSVSTSDNEEQESSLGLPSYLIAADNHSIANNNQTFLESAAETISNIPKFIGVSMLSGANQFYNILPTLGNALGGDFDISKTSDVIESIDDDLGEYYQEHGESADVLGFILSSIVPGLGGIKLLNAGQKSLETAVKTGRIGENFAVSLGLLGSKRKKFLSQAISETTNSSSLSLITNTNTLKAMAAGYGQAVLETAAFEVAVAATLSESPVLKDQDFGDLVSNIAVGGLIFGTIGGIVDVTKSSFKLKNAIKEADKDAAPFTHRTVLFESASPSNKILHDLEQVDNMKFIPLVLAPERVAFLEASAKTKVRSLMTQTRKNLGTLADGDETVASMSYTFILGKKFDDNLGDVLGATRISRITEKTSVEKIVNKADKKGATIKQAEEAAEQEFNATYTTTWGDNIGDINPLTPQHVSLSDTLKKTEEILVTPKGVTAGKRKFNFSTKGILPDKRLGKKESIPEAKGTGWDVTKVGLHEAQARIMWALETPPFVSNAAKEFKAVTIGENDIGLLDKLYREFDPRHKVKLTDGTTRSFEDGRQLLDFIAAKKESIAVELLLPKKVKGKVIAQKSQEDIASMLNIRNSYLSGTKSDDLIKDMFALESYSEEYTKLLISKGLMREGEGVAAIYKSPRTIKTSYDTTIITDLDGNVLEGMAIITQQESLQSTSVENVTAAFFKEDETKFLYIPLRQVQEANRIGAGAKFATAASSNPGSLAAHMEYLGQVTTGIIEKNQAVLREALEPALASLARSQKATIEWSTLNNTLRSLPDNYVLHESGEYLEPAVISRYNKLLSEGTENVKQPNLQNKDTPLQIPIDNSETLDLARAHISTNGKRTNSIIELRTVQGNINRRNPEVFYPMPVNPKDYPFFAIVRDRSITGAGQSRNIYATSQDQLENIKRKLSDNPELEILTKTDAENYYKSIGQYDQQRTLGDNYLDSLMQRKGLDAPALISTDPQKVTEEMLNWSLKQETSLVREMVSARYERQFEELRKRGEEFTNLSTSQFNNLATVKHAESLVKNPYMSYVKTALGIKNYSDYPFWINANKMLDSKVSEMYENITRVVESSRTVEELAEVNTLMKQYGFKGAAYDMEMDLLANHTAPRGVLQNFVQKANGILATVVLRLDHLNAVNNYISSNILYGAEMTSIIRAIERSDTNAVGELAALGKIKVPGMSSEILSPQKMLANAYKAFGKDSPDLQFFKDNRFITSISDQYKWTLDNLTLTGKESVRDLSSKLTKVHESLKSAAKKGERWTGNRLAEEFNRFAAAHTMKQVTDIAVKNGVMDSRTALSYINTFVNRTQGNYLASQRPMLFQGAIGQSIGLFQTYQFNLMQQLLRYVGEGTAKDSATLLGLQGTIFGMNGLPAFNAINTNLVGTASGNDKHKDAYTTVYGAAGKQAGDWLMYGLASNMLLHPDFKTNLYVRGDINPRHVTIVPTDPASIPIIQATGKFFGNIMDTASKIANGGDFVTSILQGLEHNSISRPLAGLAQTLEGLANPEYASYSTSRRGNVIASNDILSLTNIARMVGGKPLGEAVAIDAAYRFKAYALSDARKKSKLGSAIKSTIIAGQSPSQEQIESFTESYVKLGGKQIEFNQWMLQLYKTANTSQANALRDNLNSPFSKSMQLIMGGFELKDFENN